MTVNVQQQEVPTLTCSPQNQTVNVNQNANFSASGGTGSYAWSAPGSSGSGQNFSTNFGSPGTKSVVVSSGNQSATCHVNVQAEQISPPSKPVVSGLPSCSAGNYSATISWQGNPGSGFFVDIANNSGFGPFWNKGVGSALSTTAPNGFQPHGTAQQLTLQPDTTYFVRVFNGQHSPTEQFRVPSCVNPPTADIKANGSDGPVTIQSGTQATISWTSTNATACTVSPTGWTGTSGTQATGNLSNTQTYTVNCTGPGGSASDSVTVNVQTTSCTAPAVTTFGATNIGQNSATLSGSVNPNGRSTNVWFEYGLNTGVGTSVGHQTISGSGTQQVNFTLFNLQANSTYFFRIVAQSDCGGVQYGSILSFVTTGGGFLLPTVNLNANPTNIFQGQSSVLSWNSNNANQCFASNGWSGNKNLSGSETVFPAFTTTYTITCSNQHGTASDTETVFVTTGGTANNLQVVKSVRNITLNQNFYSSSVEAQGLDVLEFEIKVRNADNVAGQVNVRDILPTQLFYVPGSTTLNGSTAADGITTGGLALGTVNPNEEKIVRFRAVVFVGTAQQFLTNQASATMNTGVQNAFATIQIRNRGQVLGAADIVTGPEDMLPGVLIFGFLASLLTYFAAFKYRWIKVGAYAPATAAPVSDLERLVLELRASEGAPDTERKNLT